MSRYLKVAAWNLGGWQKNMPARYDYTLRSHLRRINEVNPDFLLTQEVARRSFVPKHEDWMEVLQRGTQLKHMAWLGRPMAMGQSGNGIHSRYPLSLTGGEHLHLRLPTQVPWFVSRYNEVDPIYVAANVTLSGLQLQLRGVHFPHAREEIGQPPENQYAHQSAYAQAVLRSVSPRPPVGSCVIAGDFNGDARLNVAYESLRSVGFHAPPNSKQPTDDDILSAGLDLRHNGFEIVDVHPQIESDHQMVVASYSLEEPTEEYFREASDRTTARGDERFYAGFAPTTSQFEPMSGIEIVAFRRGHVDWLDAPAVEQPAVDTRTRFTMAVKWAQARGYEHGFPNFHEAGDAQRHRYGTFLVRPHTGEFRDVSVTELGLPDPPFATPMWQWLRRVDAYASRQGFVSGLPTGDVGHRDGQRVCGVFLYDATVAERLFIPRDELRRPLPTW